MGPRYLRFRNKLEINIVRIIYGENKTTRTTHTPRIAITTVAIRRQRINEKTTTIMPGGTPGG